MEIFILLGLILFVAILLKSVGTSSEKRKVFKDNVYRYTRKDSLMTRAETEFFWKLNQVVQDRYFVFPQVHLSAVLDHHVDGQEWKYAFRHINGKSVDYVLCDRTTLRPTYAIELDDYTHDKIDRKKRDAEVERIFEEAKFPLVRFKSYKDLSEQNIVNRLSEARALANS